VWHKQCFKCTVCGMTLNMKNYKGYEKMPYCDPHYPKAVASVVSDTPEMRRLAENTKIQSNVKYHEDFEKMKGHKIQIADDPEMSRHLKNTQVISQAAYHGETERKKHQDSTRPPLEESIRRIAEPPPQQQNNGGTPYSSKMASAGTVIYSSEQGGRVPVQQRQVGSIADYDPLNGQWGTVGSSRGAQQLGSNAPPAQSPTTQFQPRSPTHTQPQQQQQHQQPASTTTPSRAPAPGTGGGFTVRALYDYSAADTDEVSFAEGDVIVNCQAVDEGWMTGTVTRTKQWGMLPANYIERVH
uniref:LIM and SH3 domain protein F42H10.3 n=1 Tax=Plectus sambesii TaxID=2011161 RepID=A0A914WIK1_9BILA